MNGFVSLTLMVERKLRSVCDAAAELRKASAYRLAIRCPTVLVPRTLAFQSALFHRPDSRGNLGKQLTGYDPRPLSRTRLRPPCEHDQ
jgi:hypothetical protein